MSYSTLPPLLPSPSMVLLHTNIPQLILLHTGWALNFILRHHPKSMLKIILTLVTLQGGMLARLPNVSYLTFFSYWSIFCILPIYSMVWQWTTSNTVGDISYLESLQISCAPGEEHGEQEVG